MNSKEKIRLLKDYIAVAQGEMSKLFFCKKHDVNFREFTKIAYVVEAELVAENEKLKQADKTPKFLNSVTEHPDVQRLIKQVIRGDTKNKQLQAELDKHRWIPVSERLPEEGQVLVLCDEKIYEVKIRITEDEDDGKLTNCDIRHLGCILLGLDNCITHWKPIILPDQARKETPNYLRQKNETMQKL